MKRKKLNYIFKMQFRCKFTFKLTLFRQNTEILEVGGGLHLLSSYLYDSGYNITSIEPGNFTYIAKKLRENVINELDPKNILTAKLEDLNSKNKYDFIFSINVLEHTESVIDHLKLQLNLLSEKNSKILVRAPNYNFPFEAHFYKFFIPLFPEFTFKKLLKKKLIKNLGEPKYFEIINTLNFDCKYSTLNKNFKIKSFNPYDEIFERLATDEAFNKRILENYLVKILYKLFLNSKVNIFDLILKDFIPT